ncbi:3077_t:CDS:2, partial [Funneliformis mosseae]
SIIKVDPFYGKNFEDAQEWIEIFLRAKEANRWPDNRRIAIAAGILREEAADWYNLHNSFVFGLDKKVDKLLRTEVKEL